jgi:imidazolonepropionase-like amidohydrolase
VPGFHAYTTEDLPWIAEAFPAGHVQRLRDALAKPAPGGSDRDSAKVYAVEARNLKKINALGLGKIGLGTDANEGTAGWGAHVEMADMVGAGMTPAQVIVAATKTNAEILRIQNEVGSIAAGKSADFLVLDANPLDNITNTRRINKVYLRGKEVDRTALKAQLARP